MAAVSQHEYWGYRKVPRHDGTIEKEAAHLEFTVPGAETIIMFADVERKLRWSECSVFTQTKLSR